MTYVTSILLCSLLSSSPSSLPLRSPAIVESRRLPLFHFQKSCHLWQMKYVRPCSLLNVMHKKAKEMSKRGAFGEFSTLFGVNIQEDFISIGTTVPRKRTPLLYGIIERKDQDILGIADELRWMNFTENVVGYVIGLPGTLKNENPEGTKVKSFVDQLCNTGKLEGLKYTYLGKKRLLPLKSKGPMGEAIQPVFEIKSGVGILQDYLKRYCKYGDEDEDEDEDEDVDEITYFE
ncbi:hypothetical protein Q3G72_019979 [Acer saccharum]|nr:hypothetical protein Q3G72_019979 [Acer saccharum]